jgi:hypothetical protein
MVLFVAISLCREKVVVVVAVVVVLVMVLTFVV